MEFKIDEELRSLIPPLSEEEYKQLEQNILQWGCLDPLKVWPVKDCDDVILLDGHNRFAICSEHNVNYATEDILLIDRAAAIDWMIDQQLGRRNLSAERIFYLRGLQYRREKAKHGSEGGGRGNQHTILVSSQNDHLLESSNSEAIERPGTQLKTAEKLAAKHGVSPRTIQRDADYSEAIDRIEEVVPGTKSEVLAGAAKLSKKDVLDIAAQLKAEPARAVEIISHKKKRIANDYYPTPEPIIAALLERVKIEGRVLEPCAGHGAIAKYFPGSLTNDISPVGDYKPNFMLDATEQNLWEMADEKGGIDWVVTNPPYGELATPIVSNSLAFARKGVAMLLRLNWLEPCRDRRELLAQYSDCMTNLIVLSPRPRFRADTGGSDNITVAWVVWQKAWSWEREGSDCPFGFLVDWRD
jgi:hypothetical protein